MTFAKRERDGTGGLGIYLELLNIGSTEVCGLCSVEPNLYDGYPLFVVLMFQVYPVDAGERSVAGTAGKPFRRIRVVLPSKAGSEMRKTAADTPHHRATDARSGGTKYPISR